MNYKRGKLPLFDGKELSKMNEELLLYLSLKYNGDNTKITEAINRQETIDFEQQKILLCDFNSNYVTILSDEYPEKIKLGENPPYVLFYKGDINLINEQSIALIGTHSLKENEIDTLKKYVLDFIQYNIPIISSMRMGAESYVFRQALSNNAKTIVVLPTGLDFYKLPLNSQMFKEIEKNGLIITQYPTSAPPNKLRMLERQKLMAKLCDCLLVGELKKNELDEMDLELITDVIYSNKNIYFTGKQNNYLDFIVDSHLFYVESVKDMLNEEFKKNLNLIDKDLERFNEIYSNVKNAINEGILKLDPNNLNNILVYRTSSNIYPDGWYSQDIIAVVFEMFNNEKNYEDFLDAVNDLQNDEEMEI